MRYLISGAWGYGNIGDDAILEATLDLLKKRDPDAEVVCVTYDLQYTSEAGLNLPGPLLPSMHRVLSGTEGFWFMTTKDHAVSCYEWPWFFKRIYQRFLKPTCERWSCWLDRRKTRGGYERLVEEFEKADCFIMSGGGYFNTWPEQFKARIRELELAHQHGCKVVLVGQSIGPFTEEQKEILKRTLLPTDAICVRDPESVDELNALGFEADLAPDLAMGPSRQVTIDKGLLTVCPAEINAVQEVELARQIARLVKEYGYRVRLTITRWIDPDVATLHRVRKLLRKLGVSEVEMTYPKTYPDVLKAIEGSEWILSRGLHAMILAWRTGTRVFALTKSRKVDGFLLAIESAGNQCKESEWSELAQRFDALAKKDGVWNGDLHEKVTHDIESAFEKVMAKAGV